MKYIFADVSEDKKTVEILLEYVPNGSIKNLLDKYGAFNEKIVRIYTKQIIEGIDYLHTNNIIHRDLKCANVLVDNDAKIKLTDFGSSKKLIEKDSFDNFESSKSLKGSPYWMAPEVQITKVVQRIGHGTPADIWSIGCVVIEMLTGKPPWISPLIRLEELFLKIARTTEGPPYPPDISAECLDFLNNCFIIDPEKRPTCKDLLIHPFINGSEKNPLLDAKDLMGQISIILKSKLIR